LSANKPRKEIRCVRCGSKNVVAKIMGEYYCYECGSKIVDEHLTKLMEEFKKKGLAKF